MKEFLKKWITPKNILLFLAALTAFFTTLFGTTSCQTATRVMKFDSKGNYEIMYLDSKEPQKVIDFFPDKQ